MRAGIAAMARQIDRAATYLAMHRWIMIAFSTCMVGWSGFWLGVTASTDSPWWRFALHGLNAVVFVWLTVLHHRNGIQIAITTERLRQYDFTDQKY